MNNKYHWNAYIITTEKQTEIVPDIDVRMMGNVTWAGRSSMEVTMKLQQVMGSYSTYNAENREKNQHIIWFTLIRTEELIEFDLLFTYF